MTVDVLNVVMMKMYKKISVLVFFVCEVSQVKHYAYNSRQVHIDLLISMQWRSLWGNGDVYLSGN